MNQKTLTVLALIALLASIAVYGLIHLFFSRSSRSFSRVPPNFPLGVKTVANRTAKVGVYSLSVSPYKSGGPESGFIFEVKYNNINLTIG